VISEARETYAEESRDLLRHSGIDGRVIENCASLMEDYYKFTEIIVL
jgi:hypothetical protein